MPRIELIRGDCLEEMKNIPDKSIGAVICDPPYGTTNCKWDTIIPFEPMWKELKRVIRPRGAIVLFASQPFTSALIMSNPKMFKYEWIWDKVTARGHLVAKKRPMAQHENICVFGDGAVTYNPQMTLKNRPERGSSVETSRTSLIGGTTTKKKEFVIRTHSYPKTIQTFGMDKRVGHPTQKPVALMQYLIKTYTDANETVLDFTAGSFTTAIAALNSERSFIGIENNEDYFQMGKDRVEEHLKTLDYVPTVCYKSP